MGSEDEDLKLHSFWGSPYGLRVIWALKIKGIEFEYIEESLREKSPLLLQYNPVHKKVPVLVHNGKPLAESLVIIEYIDETWSHEPLLPLDPFERAKARFWAKFSDEKCIPEMKRVLLRTGEEQEEAARGARDALKTLEGGLEGKRFFGGEKIGFADIAIGWLGFWIRVNEEIVGVKLIDEKEVPVLSQWFSEFLETPTIKECLPPYDKLLQHVIGFHNKMVGNAISS